MSPAVDGLRGFMKILSVFNFPQPSSRQFPLLVRLPVHLLRAESSNLESPLPLKLGHNAARGEGDFIGWGSWISQRAGWHAHSASSPVLTRRCLEAAPRAHRAPLDTSAERRDQGQYAHACPEILFFINCKQLSLLHANSRTNGTVLMPHTSHPPAEQSGTSRASRRPPGCRRPAPAPDSHPCGPGFHGPVQGAN